MQFATDRVDTNNDDESDPAGILEPFEQGATLEGKLNNHTVYVQM
jgi:hypothetical protein